MNTHDTKDVQKLIDEEVSKSYFYGWNLLVNGLLAMIPTGVIIQILKELGVRGGLVTVGVLFGFIYLIGLAREKISGSKNKTFADGGNQ